MIWCFCHGGWEVCHLIWELGWNEVRGLGYDEVRGWPAVTLAALLDPALLGQPT